MCSRVTMLRQRFAERRSRLARSLRKLSGLRSKDARRRRGILVSTNALRRGLLGKLRSVERRELVDMDDKIARSGVEAAKAVECLRTATELMDEVVHSPFLIKDSRYSRWEWALDLFLKEVRGLVQYQMMEDTRLTTLNDSESTVMVLCERLHAMRLSECLQEQEGIRYQCKLVVNHLFDEGEAWTEALCDITEEELALEMPDGSPPEEATRKEGGLKKKVSMELEDSKNQVEKAVNFLRMQAREAEEAKATRQRKPLNRNFGMRK